MIAGMMPAAGANQFAQTANQIQSNAAYMGGRLTPQAMQQGLTYDIPVQFCHPTYLSCVIFFV